ncbi:S53 family peptidase [Rudaeicoccus suwonensis]|uniref:Pro-kumamolisin-like protein n=1 Tax=Rudaeicoccus suwonensis TaxID=657409 RepID=A0A561E3I3_9MICO|nr:S53 family peptidase [Rudaeicoccus suwonensis]TWE10151.1 pro-kumamolisin-like protein [Rudaeicoccus suwonensis]
MRHSNTGRRTAATVAGAGCLTLAVAATLGAGTAHAATAGTNDKIAIATGTSPGAMRGADGFGNTPSNTPEAVSFVLNERNKAALEAQVERGAGHQLNVRQFATQYGQSDRTIRELTSYLSSFGIKTTVYADHVDIAATGTAGEFDKALATTQEEFHVPGQRARDGQAAVPAQTVHAPRTQPRLPRKVAGSVLAVLGLSNYSPYVSNAQHVPAASKSAGTSGSCETLTPGDGADCNLPSNFVQRYGLTNLEKSGVNGSGQTLGIVTLAALDPGAPQYFWSHIARVPSTGRTVSVQNIDGGPGAPSDASGSGETDLDVEQSGGVAPGANVIVYQAPNTDNGFADAFFSAASQNIAGSVSSSWGESETVVQSAVASGEETPAYEAAFDEAFLELAAQGQATFVSAGDSGAYDASGDLGSTNLSVDTPGDSPYVTSAGGTTLPWSGTVSSAKTGKTAAVSEPITRTWGWDYLWPAFAKVTGTSEAQAAVANIAGGGGGFSTVESQPSYQRGVPGTNSYRAVPFLTPTAVKTVGGIQEPTAWTFDAHPTVVTGRGNGRAEPDIAADADPFTGYQLYEPSASPALQAGWGGTSFVAPQLNGSAAVIDQAVGHRVGFWNPAVYGLATTFASPFKTINASGVSSSNMFFTGNPGTVYNPGSGLGSPDLGKLAADLRWLWRR